MSIQEIYDIYPICQKFLLDFGFKQDDDWFTLYVDEEDKDYYHSKFTFPSIVTVEELNSLCSAVSYILYECYDDSDWETTKSKVVLFRNFIFSIQHCFTNFVFRMLFLNYTFLADERQEIKELKASIKNNQ
jgi:hypothetical protein